MVDSLRRIEFMWPLLLSAQEFQVRHSEDPLLPSNCAGDFYFEEFPASAFKIFLRAWDTDAYPRMEVDIDIPALYPSLNTEPMLHAINRINFEGCGASLVLDPDKSRLMVRSRLVLSARIDAWAELSGEQAHDLRESTLNWMLPCINLSHHAASVLRKMQVRG